jgi:DNA modification methylase
MISKPNDFFSDDISISTVESDCSKENLVITSNIEVFSIPIENLSPHPLAQLTYQTKSLFSLKLSLLLVGQLENITVKMNKNGQYQIIDGISRFLAAQELDFKFLNCIIINVDDSKVPFLRIQKNIFLPKSLIERIKMVDEFLNKIGSSQGKQRNLKDLMELIGEYKVIPSQLQGRYDIVRTVFDLKYSISTLIKLHKIYKFEHFGNDEIQALKLMEKIDQNIYSIDGAYKLMTSLINKKERKENREILEKDRVSENVWFKVFEQSSTNLSNLAQLKPSFAMFSPPYWKMRQYRNQGMIRYGQEPTLSQYFHNSKKIMQELIKIMDDNGVIVIVIGESYKYGYKSITSKYEMMLLECGLEILGVCEWVKKNPNPVVPDYFFRPANEKIFVCKIKGAKINFNSKRKPTKDQKISIKKCQTKKGSENRYYVQEESTIITNVITTPSFNPFEYKKYDPTFSHDAPCPMEIYDIFTGSYTLPGMTAIDIFCGSGQGMESFVRHGCNAIGVDIDHESVEFCKKRMNMVLGKENELISAA